MKRVDEFQFYRLATILNPLVNMKGEMKKDIYFDLLNAKTWISWILSGGLVPIVVSKSAFGEVLGSISAITPDTEKPHNINWDEAVEPYKLQRITSAAR